jgi:hypothetical protein
MAIGIFLAAMEGTIVISCENILMLYRSDPCIEPLQLMLLSVASLSSYKTRAGLRRVIS